MRCSVVLALLVLVTSNCAKKMLPPSPDRFPPRLVEVDARSRVQVELIFDEDIDPARFQPESISISDLRVRGVSAGRQRSSVLIWTESQRPESYFIKGVIWDAAGNAGRFRAGFRGSSRADTIPPQVVAVQPAPESKGMLRSVRIAVRFSEPVDTTAPVNYLIVPRVAETLFVKSWEPSWQEFRLVCRESLPGTEFYFLLLPGIPDLENNPSRMPAWTSWTAETVFAGIRIQGRVSFNGQPVRSGAVFFNQEETRALAPILADGSFGVKLRAGVYSVFAAGDTDYNGRAELISPEIQFNTEGESLELMMLPESLPRMINEYCR
ncbi:MAG: Ig-like domain-containing protein [candidate division WOR-3 bacterium]